MIPSFKENVERVFDPLSRKYDLRVLAVRCDRFGEEVVIGNSTTAIRLRYEPRESRVFASVLRLTDGGVPRRDIDDRIKDPINGFDLLDLVKMRSPSLRVPEVPPGNTALLDAVLTDYASFLWHHGQDLLTGDFSVFVDLAHEVANRIRSGAAQGKTAAPEWSSFLTAVDALDRARTGGSGLST